VLNTVSNPKSSISNGEDVLPSQSNKKDKSASLIAEKNMLEFDSKKQGNVKWLIKVYEGDKKVAVYADDLDTNQFKVNERTISFKEQHGVSNFLKNSAYINTGGKFYISGGEVELNKPSNVMLVYDPQASSLTRLPDMPVGKSSHSMIINADCIYLVGLHQQHL